MEIIKIDITKEISGDLYHRLINFASGRYPLFLFVKRKDVKPGLNSKGEKVIHLFSPFLKSTVESVEWPGTKVIQSAEVFYFNLTEESVELLKRQSNSLYDWQHPSFPEDLCIMRNMKQPWLCNIAHEKIAMIYVSPTDKMELLEALPELSLHFGKEEKSSAYY